MVGQYSPRQISQSTGSSILPRLELFREDRVVDLVHAEIRSGSVRRHDAERDALGRVRRCRDEERRLKTALRAGVEQLQSLDHAVADQYFPVDGHLSGKMTIYGEVLIGDR